MKKIIMLCVGVLGAANQASFAAGNAGYGIAVGGCYGQPAYRSPVAQNGPSYYSGGSSNCANGQCANGKCANGRCAPIGSAYRSNGQYAPLSYTAGTANYPNGQYSPLNFTSGNVECRDGQCHLKRNPGSTTGNIYGANHRLPVLGNYHPSTAGSRYNQYPDTRFGGANSPPLHGNPYSARPAYDVNWTNTYRPVQPSSYQNSTSPFFN